MPPVRLDLSVEAARGRLIDRMRPLPAEKTSLRDARGLVAAAEIVAPIELPRFTNSAMDGYALRSADIADASEEHPIRLAVAGTLEAGSAWLGSVAPREAVRISTGAAIPSGCDSVAPTELVRESNGEISIQEAVEPGRHVRARGEDIEAGATAIGRGTRIRPQEIGLLAALGIESIRAIPLPAVSIVSLGPELFSGALPVPVYDANAPMLAAQVEQAGGEVISIERCDGDLDELFGILDYLADRSDLIVTSGGISDSPADTMAEVLEPHPNAELWNVRLRPGKHFGVGYFEGHTILSLPGNPIAAFVGFELFGRLAIDLLSSLPVDGQRLTARTAAKLAGTLGRTDALRGHAWIDAHGQLWTRPTANRGSGATSSLPEANCLILIPEMVTMVESGDYVEIRWVGYQ